MKSVKLAVFALSLTLSLLLAGCQTGPAAATQPSLAMVTTQAESSLDAAVNAIHLAIDLKLIDGATYWRDIDPVITAAQASCATMRADAIAGNVSGANAASNAVLAAVAKLEPFLARTTTPTTNKAK